jgi:hypothetical protein
MLSASNTEPAKDTDYEEILQRQLDLDWQSFCRRHLGTAWLDAYKQTSNPPKDPDQKASTWLVHIIFALW